jgi:hypothetical protein
MRFCKLLRSTELEEVWLQRTAVSHEVTLHFVDGSKANIAFICSRGGGNEAYPLVSKEVCRTVGAVHANCQGTGSVG